MAVLPFFEYPFKCLRTYRNFYHTCRILDIDVMKKVLKEVLLGDIISVNANTIKNPSEPALPAMKHVN